MAEALINHKGEKSSAKWRYFRRTVQVLALLIFLYLLLATRQNSTTWLPHDLFFRLDPLTGITAMLASHTWMAPLALGIITLLLTLAVSRAWCGWLCPLGTILDWTPSRRLRKDKIDIPSFWRHGKYLLLAVIVFTAMLGSLTLIFLDPITLLFRAIASFILPGLSALLANTGIPDWLNNLLRGAVINDQPFWGPNVAIALFFAVVLVLNAIRARFWCRYLCPLGGLLGLIGKITWLRHYVDEHKCISCRRCAIACPTAAIDPAQKFAANIAECITCLKCAEVCPTQAISFRNNWKLAPQHHDPSRRRFLVTASLAAIAAAVLKIAPLIGERISSFIRPPGSSESSLQTKCIRCGECARVCPTGVIQPAAPSGAKGKLWTPQLETRLAYCDFSCNSCGQVCPTGAIAPLALEDKRKTVIGIAKIDRTRCIPWNEGTPCGVCEEMCPVPQKAIAFNEGGGQGRGGGRNGVQRPHVLAELCIGCGICETYCPVPGESAIRVLPAPEA
ncbi:MAG: 4Fe-4S binding protein [Dehalococcoidales bacterium]|nr:4Fe-4S binding protein [Dehalococcoidales bacterium]